MATATSMDYVQKIFIAYLGRGASTEALEYWGQIIDDQGEAGKEAFFYNIWSGDEAETLYAGMTEAQIITLIFTNSFEREPSAEGITYWEGELASGAVNVVSLAGAIVDAAGTTDAAIYDYKNQAADYYRTEMDDNSKDFSPTQSLDAVKDVEGPSSLADSKSATDAIASVTALVAAMTAGNDALAMTAEDDVVTATDETMGNTGTNIDTMLDTSTTDSDTLTITAADDVNFATITNVETINLSMEKIFGAALQVDDLDKVTGDGTTLNLTVAETTSLGGVSGLDAETRVDIDSLSVDLTTTNVTDLTVSATSNDANTITGDADLAIIGVTSDAGAGGNDALTVVLANNDAELTVNLGTDAADSLTISAVGALDVNATHVENYSISGNGGAVAVDLKASSTAADFTVTGTQNVTITAVETVLTGTTLTDSSTGGTTSLVLAGSAADKSVDLTGVGTLSGTIDVSDGNVDSVTLKGGNNLVVDTNSELALASNDASDGSIDIKLVGTSVLTETGFETIGFTTNDAAATDTTLTTTSSVGNDVTITFASNNDATLDLNSDSNGGTITVNSGVVGEMDHDDTDLDVMGAVGGISITSGATGAISGAFVLEGNDGAISLTLESTSNDVDVNVTNMNDITNNEAATLTVTADGEATVTIATNGIDASNDSAVVITGDGITLDNGVNSNDNQGVDVTLTATGNDIAVTGANVESGPGDITATAATSITATALDFISGAGDISLTATGNDISVTTGDIFSTSGDITLVAGQTITADHIGNDADTDAAATTGDITITAGNLVIGGVIQSTDGAVAITTTGGVSTIAETVSGETITLTAGNDITLTTGATADAIVASGAGDVNLGNVTTYVVNSTNSTGDITITNTANAGSGAMAISTGAGNDNITVNDNAVAFTVIAGEGANTFTLTDSATGTSYVGGSGVDTINVNDTGAATTVTYATGGGADIVTIADGAGGKDTIETGDGNDSITIADELQAETVTVNGGNDTDTLVFGTDAISHTNDLVISNIEIVDITAGDQGITASTFAGDNVFLLKDAGDTSNVLTITGDTVTGSTINASGITVDGFEEALVTLVGSAGGDSLTGSAYGDTINGLAGNDVIIGGAGGDTIDGGAGVDTITLGTTADVDNVKMETVKLAANLDNVTNFTVGTAADDKVTLGKANTTLNTADGAAVVGNSTTAAGAGGGALALTGATTSTKDVIIFNNVTAAGTNSGDLSKSLDGTELLKALTSDTAADTYTGITAVASSKVYLSATQGGVTYLYYAENDGDTLLEADEIFLIGTFDAELDAGSFFLL
jgi:Ca2+-binding RTX toxin-like protein